MNHMNLKRFGIMLDCSRNGVMNLKTVKGFIDIISKLGYNCLLLYTEDTYEIKGRPYFGHNRGRYSVEEIKEMDAYAKNKGIELIPCIQTLAHLGGIFRWPEYGKINDCYDILLAEDERTYDLIDDMFASLSQSYSSRVVNIGMDEAHSLGKGKYMDINGNKPRFDIFIKHLNRVSEIAKKYGFSIIMWGDMFLGGDLFLRLMRGEKCESEELVATLDKRDTIPENVNIVYWDYYSLKDETYDTLMQVYSELKPDIWFAGGLWSWTGFAPHNRFSEKVTEIAFRNCVKNNVENVFLTMWGDNGNECSKFSLLPSLYYASQLVKGITDMKQIKDGFYEEYGIEYDDFMLLDLPGTHNEQSAAVVNCEKYLLYNDCFMGLFDNTVTPDLPDMFTQLVSRLSKLCGNEKYGYMFRTARELCRILELKADIGLRTREAYSKNDKNALKHIADDYGKIAERIDSFYSAFEMQWMAENKPQGFDVQDIRLGGIKCRVKHCQSRLLKFISGEVEKIDELKEPVLDVLCREETAGQPLQFECWERIVTANTI